MIVTLTTGTSYNLLVDDDRRRLGNYIPVLARRRRTKELDNIYRQFKNIRSQIELQAIASSSDVEVYRFVNGEARVVEFPTRYYDSSKDSRISSHSRYTFLNNQFYRLPVARDDESIQYALIDKYVYERQRNDVNSEACIKLKLAIEKLMPSAADITDKELEQILSERETLTRTYYGDCLSDNSDSDEEREYAELPIGEKNNLLLKASNYREKAKYLNHQQAMETNSKSIPYDKACATISRNQDTQQAKEDLRAINSMLEQHGNLTLEVLNNLSTRFVVAQYRGIHYSTSKWDTVLRRWHRKADERRLPQYSGAVFEACRTTPYHSYRDQMSSNNDSRDGFNREAQRIFELLLLMQHSSPVTYNKYTYVSLFHLLQNLYSSNYDNFSTTVSQNNTHFAPFLANNARPFLSTADTPYHALKYAYGIKLYEGHKDERLRPRWRESGQAERPYSGKVYVSLHPITDYTELNPSHITSLFKQGTVTLGNIISSERETSFLGFLPKDRVVLQHVAKYPSFKGGYKSIYESKYGISKSMYEVLQNAFSKHPPHSSERKNLILLLGEYLCAYQEVKLIQEAQDEAEKNGAVLIYRNEDGGFSLCLPDVPHTANKRLNPVVMAKRELYRELASNNNSERITALTREQFELSMRTRSHSEHHMEGARFFGNKRNFSNGEPITPPKIVMK